MTQERTPNEGFTIIEVMVVLIIVGVLTSLAIPGFFRTKERAFDKEAQIELNLIVAGEKMYRAKISFYYPFSGTVVRSDIENNLQLDLSSSAWEYTITDIGSGGVNFNAVAARNGPASWSRQWSIDASGVLSCASTCGSSCVSNVCPPS
ncbi:MAG: prepilin-type N-terminal cleavage/methylation domain-containing protein [Candidatus Omnitrophota bacterium]|nr:prepilin-type N-terminal cleavage/methylation domain-containing protein [Candidatus Omnitrophota bacterium]